MTFHEPDTDAKITSVCISPDGRMVAASSDDMIVRIWDLQTGQVAGRLRAYDGSVSIIAFTSDGRKLLTASPFDKKLTYWDMQPLLSRPQSARDSTGDDFDWDGACLAGFEIHKDVLLSCAASCDGQWVVSGSKNCTMQFWDANTEVMALELRCHNDSGELTAVRQSR